MYEHLRRCSCHISVACSRFSGETGAGAREDWGLGIANPHSQSPPHSRPVRYSSWLYYFSFSSSEMLEQVMIYDAVKDTGLNVFATSSQTSWKLFVSHIKLIRTSANGLCNVVPSWFSGPCRPVGVQDPSRIPDSSMNASSYYDRRYYPHYGRLHETRGGGGWCPVRELYYNTDSFLQIDMGAQRTVCAVATQGNTKWPKWTTRYKLSLSRDGVTWSFYQENSAIKVTELCRDFVCGTQHSSSFLLLLIGRAYPNNIIS